MHDLRRLAIQYEFIDAASTVNASKLSYPRIPHYVHSLLHKVAAQPNIEDNEQHLPHNTHGDRRPPRQLPLWMLNADVAVSCSISSAEADSRHISEQPLPSTVGRTFITASNTAPGFTSARAERVRSHTHISSFFLSVTAQSSE